MKKALFLSATVLAFGFSFLLPVNQAQATLLPVDSPENYYDEGSIPTNDSAEVMTSILGYDVLLLDKWEPDNSTDDLLEGSLEVDLWDEDPDSTWEGEPRYADIEWDLDDEGYQARVVAVKDGNANSSGIQWIFYPVDSDQWIEGSGVVNTIANGAGAISHISLYGTAAPVPEPATMLLLGSGLAALAAFRRKLRKK